MESRNAEQKTLDKPVKEFMGLGYLLHSLSTVRKVIVKQEEDEEVNLNCEYESRSSEMNVDARDNTKSIKKIATVKMEQQNNQELGTKLNGNDDLNYLRGLLEPEAWAIDAVSHADDNDDDDDESDIKPLKKSLPPKDFKSSNGACQDNHNIDQHVDDKHDDIALAAYSSHADGNEDDECDVKPLKKSLPPKDFKSSNDACQDNHNDDQHVDDKHDDIASAAYSGHADDNDDDECDDVKLLKKFLPPKDFKSSNDACHDDQHVDDDDTAAYKYGDVGHISAAKKKPWKQMLKPKRERHDVDYNNEDHVENDDVDRDDDDDNEDDDDGDDHVDAESGGDDDVKKSNQSLVSKASWESTVDENNNSQHHHHDIDVNNNIPDIGGNSQHDKNVNVITSTLEELKNSAKVSFHGNQKGGPSCMPVTSHQVSSLETCNIIQRDYQCSYCQRSFKHNGVFKYHEMLHRRENGKSYQNVAENCEKNKVKQSSENSAKSGFQNHPRRKRVKKSELPKTNVNWSQKNDEYIAENAVFPNQMKRKRERKSVTTTNGDNGTKNSEEENAENDDFGNQKKRKRKTKSNLKLSETVLNETNTKRKTRETKCKKARSSNQGEKLEVGVVERYACNFCDKTYTNASHFNKHFAMHTGVNPYKCFCGKSFKTTTTLDEHTKEQHPDYKPFLCDICGNKFRNQKQLKGHMYTHSEVKKYKCSFCDYSSNKKSCLDCHVLTHTGVKPHVCSYCGRAFAKKWTLTDHVKIHTGAKPHKCTLCDAEFAQRNTLKNHMASHSGEKNHQCPHCGVRVRRKTYLNQHIRDVCKVVGKKYEDKNDKKGSKKKIS